MAISKVSDRGTKVNTSAANTVVVTLTNPTVITVGNYLILRLVCANSGGGGAARTISSVTDPRSNSWTRVLTQNIDPGSADAGCTTHLLYARVASAYQAGDTITVNLSGNVTKAAGVIEEWTGLNATEQPSADSGTGNTANTTNPAPVTGLTPALADYLVYVVDGWRGPSTDGYTADADVLEGSWTALTKLGTGTTTTDWTVCGDYKVVSGTSAQSHQASGGWGANRPAASVGTAAFKVLVVATNANAIAATGTGAAEQPSGTAAAGGTGEASATATAQQAQGGAGAAAGAVPITAAAYDITTTEASTPTEGTATGTSGDTTSSVRVNPVEISRIQPLELVAGGDLDLVAGGTLDVNGPLIGAAQNATTEIEVNVEEIAGTGTAYDTTVETVSDVEVQPTEATGTGSVDDPSTAVDVYPVADGDFDPSTITSLSLWLKADSLALNDGDPISSWPDDSSNGYDASGSGDSRPTFKTNIINGQPVARFDGADILTCAAPGANNEWTFVVVLKVTDATTARPIIAPAGGVGGYGIYYAVRQTSGVPGVDTCGISGVGDADTSIVDGDFHAIAVRFSDTGNTIAFTLEGTPDGGGSPADVFAGAWTTAIGQWGTTGWAFLGDIAEILKFDAPLSDSDLNAVGGYLQGKYGLTWEGAPATGPAGTAYDTTVTTVSDVNVDAGLASASFTLDDLGALVGASIGTAGGGQLVDTFNRVDGPIGTSDSGLVWNAS